jgi:hypothetical protein
VSSDCHLNLCVVWWVHYLATVSQSQLKLNSEGCYSRVSYNNYHHHNSLTWTTWTENPLSTSLSQLQKLKRDRAQWVSEKKVANIIQNNYACTAETMTTSLRTANFCLLYNLVSSMLCCWDCEEDNRRREELRKRVAFSRSCSWECTRCDKSWKKFEKQMNSALFTMSTLVNKKSYAHTLYNTECLFYEIITSCFARNHNLQCMKIRPCMITGLMNLQVHQ